MTTLCETVESVATAVSSATAAEVIMVVGSRGRGANRTIIGISPTNLGSEGAGTSAATVVDIYAIMLNTAIATSSASPAMVVSSLMLSAARASDDVIVALDLMAQSVANAEDDIYALNIPPVFLSVAQATSSIEMNSILVITAGSEAHATGYGTLGLLEIVTSTGDAAASVAILRRIEVQVDSSGEATDDAIAGSTPQSYLLISVGNATSVAMIQTDRTLFMESVATGFSQALYQNPAAKAWVLNTESTGVSWYDNFDFNSVAQPPGKVLAVGPGGLYELTGNTDEGSQIPASVQSGFMDFGTPNTKRVDALYFGYTSENGKLQTKVETLESGTPSATYLLEQRAASAPRNSRVLPGKGMFGRYWRVTIQNTDGADFEVKDIGVDIAVSSRRV